MSAPIGPVAAPPAPPPAPPPDAARLRAAAEALEASFLAVMLQAAGVGAPREAMGGGVGEAQFASFLTEAHAQAMVRRGGIGLAESLFAALQARAEAPPGAGAGMDGAADAGSGPETLAGGKHVRA